MVPGSVHGLIPVELEAESSILFEATEDHQLWGEGRGVHSEVSRPPTIDRISCLLEAVTPHILGVHSHTQVEVCLVREQPLQDLKVSESDHMLTKGQPPQIVLLSELLLAYYFVWMVPEKKV